MHMHVRRFWVHVCVPSPPTVSYCLRAITVPCFPLLHVSCHYAIMPLSSIAASPSDPGYPDVEGFRQERENPQDAGQAVEPHGATTQIPVCPEAPHDGDSGSGSHPRVSSTLRTLECCQPEQPWQPRLCSKRQNKAGEGTIRGLRSHVPHSREPGCLAGFFLPAFWRVGSRPIL